ncbi:Chromate resistance protein ChrB [Arthrobacter sp. RCC_34]|uniref:Chromate resistance protein ChrB n=1 Tax=Arthrobacter sp. RCC_34 TaxID=3239230 RepID=UPI00352581A9
MGAEIEWVLAVVQVPAEPSRHRVAVWRELRRAGAVLISQSTWALPATEPFRSALEKAAQLADDGGGTLATFDAGPRDSASRAVLEAAFRAARVDEWGEFLADCGKFAEEIDREIAKEKFTFAELEEEEQSLDRLRRWFRDLKKRDVLALPEAQQAVERLAGCEGDLNRFSEHVYRATREARA